MDALFHLIRFLGVMQPSHKSGMNSFLWLYHAVTVIMYHSCHMDKLEVGRHIQ